MADILPFRDPYAPLAGPARLAARRIFRAECKSIAATVVAQAFTEVCKQPGVRKLAINDTHPLFVAAMRRELRKTGLF